MNAHSVRVLDVRFDRLTTEKLLRTLEVWMTEERTRLITTPNSEMLVLARNDSSFRSVLNESDLAVPDAIGVVYAAAAESGASLARHPGVNTLHEIVRLAHVQGKRVLLFGGNPGSAERAATHLEHKHPGLVVRGYDPGRVRFDANGNVHVGREALEYIDTFKPDVLAVALGHKKQETFMMEYKDRLETVRIAIGIGGALEMVGGERMRAPEWMQKRGLEWVWRVSIEPARWKRIFTASIVFPCIVGYHCLKQGHFFKSSRRVLPVVWKHISK